MKRYLILPTSIDLVRIAPERIVYIASDGNYSTLVQTDNEVRMLSFQLGQIEKMIANQLGSDGNVFIRMGKSLIINRSYIYYINIPKQKLILSDVATFKQALVSDFGIVAPKIAVLALNPHAGDGGLLGSEEQEVIAPAIREAFNNGILAFGPFAADGLFASGSYTKYDGILAM